MVRVEGVEPSSQPWEGHIIAVIRHPREGLINDGFVRLVNSQLSSSPLLRGLRLPMLADDKTEPKGNRNNQQLALHPTHYTKKNRFEKRFLKWW